MAKNKLTIIEVKKAKPKSKEYRLSDGASLYARIRPSGAKSWIFRFRLGCDRRIITITLGDIDRLSLDKARKMVAELQILVKKGIDPRKARANAIAQNIQAITMQELFNDWIEFVKCTDSMSLLWVKRHKDRWRLHLQKSLGNIFVKDVTRAHLASVLDAMTRKGIKEETRKALTTLNLMLDHGLTRHSIEHNPARMLKPKDFAASANRGRDRFLTITELKKLWITLDSASTVSIFTATAIKLLILTGARRSEVASMRWDELDINTGKWSLPANKTKNKQAHTIYLSNLAIQLISNVKLLSGQSEFVFDTGKNTGHLHPDSLTTALNRLLKSDATKDNFLSEIKPFSIHDLRRSAATAWGEYLKVAPHIIERMLNHQPPNKLIATYQRAVYVEEQKAAWIAWGKMVEQQVFNTASNVLLMTKFSCN